MTNPRPALRVFLLSSLLLLFGTSIRGQNRGTFIGPVNYPAGSAVASTNTGFLIGGVVPFEAKLGDVNGDGKPDLIVAASCSTFFSSQCANGYAVVTYISNGDGTFQPPIVSGGSTTSPPIRSMAVGDFNNDGKLDVAVASDCQLSTTSGGCITILIGVGDGTFVQSAQYTFDGIVSQSGTLAVGDFNHDGKLDLVVGDACFNLSVTSCANGAVRIFLGNGDGTLAAPTNYTTIGNSAVYPIVGDFNGDGNLDIIAGTSTPSGSLLTILIGNGNGTFTQSAATLPFFGLSALAAADLNGDGKLDLAIPLTNGGALQILFGNGDGTFQTPIPVSTSLSNQVTNGNTILPIDLNGDGKPDLIVSGGFWGTNVNGVQIFLNDGTGNFTSTLSYPMGGWQYNPIVAADFNGDGKTDVVMASGVSENVNHGGSDGSIVVLLGNGDGTFQGPVILMSPGGGAGVFAAGAADFNRDGIPDLFASNACLPGSSPKQCGAAVLLGNSNGTYLSPTIVQTGAQAPTYSIAGDFSGDGKADLAILNACDSTATCNSPSVSILLGNGDGTFQPAVTYPAGGTTPVGIVTGDFNGDGKLDLAVATQCLDSSCTQGAVSILLGNGDGTFQNAVTTGIGVGIGASIAAGDFDHDGKTDVVVSNTNATPSNPYAQFVTILLSNGDGTLRVAASYDSGGAIALFSSLRGGVVAVGDINHDGKLDVVVANGCESDVTHDVSCANGSIGVLLGNGDGTFQPVQETVVTDGNLISANLTDIDGDGNLDMIASTLGGVMVARGKGNGTFLPPVIYGGLGEIQNEVLAVADLNNDGAPDIVQPDTGGNLAIFYNRGGTFINTQSSLNPSTLGQTVMFTTAVTGSIVKNVTPTGTVALYVGNTITGTLFGTASLIGGTASLSLSNLPVGTWPITIAYSGDTNFNPHNSQTLVQVVTASLASTQTTLISSLNPSGAGQSVTFTATVSGGASLAGTIAFKDGSTTLATVALTGNQASYSTSSLVTGSHAITATYSGDGSNASSTSAVLYQSAITVLAGTVLEGVVTNQVTGQPISGAAVTFYGPTLLTVNTDANGYYFLTGQQWPYLGNAEMWIVAPGYFTPVLPVNIATPFPVTMNRALIPGGPIVRGVVTDANSNLPIANANILYSSQSFYPGAGTRSVQTDTTGNYIIDSSQFNESIATTGTQVSVTVSNTGYLQASATVQAAPPYPATQNFSLTTATTTLLQGTVTDQSTGQPINNAAVTLYGPSLITVNTDASGNYAVTGQQWPYTGSATMWIVAPGYFTPVLPVNIATPFPVTMNRALIPGGPIVRGVVTDANSNLPIANANVLYRSNDFYPGAGTRAVQTDTAGNYSIDSSQFNESIATAGTQVSVTVSNTGYLQASASVPAVPPYPTTQNFSLTPATTTLLQGTVTDQSTGQPINNAAVTLYGPSLITVNTDASGNYAVTGQQWPYTGSATMWIVAPGYFTPVLPVNIATPFPVTVNRALIPGGPIVRGTVTDANSNLPIANANILYSSQSFYPGAGTRSVQTDIAGNYIIDSSQFNESIATTAAQISLTVNTQSAYFQTGASVNAKPPFPLIQNFSLVPTGATQTITIATNPPGLSITVDGIPYTAPQACTWIPGNPHTIATTTPQASAAPGTQYAFASWNDGGALSHTIVVPGANATYTASFTSQYQLTTSASPAAGGNITAGGFYNAGSSVTISATPNSGYTFTGFSGDLAGTTNPQTLVMNGPKSVTASFAPAVVPTTATLSSTLNPAVFGQSVTFVATISGGNSPTGSASFFDGALRLATVPLAGSQASYTTSSLGAGTHSITAVYSGDSANAGSTSAALYQTVIAAPPNAVLIGVVTDRNTGTPLPGVNVIFGCSSCSVQTVTDGNGQYSLTAAQISNNSNSILIFQGHGYFANLVNYSITNSPTTVNATLLPGGTLIQGTITDANTHLPIAGAQVGISNSTQTLNGLSTTSDSSGNYAIDSSTVFESVAGGFFSQGLSATASGYFTYIGSSFQVAPPYPVVMNAAMIPAVGTVLQGTVTDRNTGTPLSGVNVIYGCSSCSVQTVTDGNGQYSLTAAQIANNSNSVLIFQGHGYFANLVNYSITSSPTTVNATLLPGGTLVQGTVADANTHLPIAGASVGISNNTQTLNGLSTTTDGNGNYAFDSSLVMESAAGGFASQGLFATSPGYFTYLGNSFQVAPPYPVVMNVAMIPAVGTVLQGTVTDRNTGTPLSGVNVIYGCSSCSVQTVTDGNGQYSLTAAQIANNSNSVLIFQGHGYFANLVNYSITSSPTTVNATLLPGGTLIQGTITDANTHLPIAGAQVGVSNNTQTLNGLSTTSDSSGNYAIDSSTVFESVASGFSSQGLSVVSSPGYFTFIGSPFTVQPPYPVIQNAQMTPTGVTVSVTVTTAPANVQFTVDGVPYSSSTSFTWVPGNAHAIAALTPQAGTPGTQYVFSTWSNNGPAQQTIVVPTASTTYTANFATQYLLSTAANPSAGGSVTTGGWFNAGASVAISATANSGYTFTGFSGDLSGTTNPQTLVMSAPKSVTANFALAQVATSTTLTASVNPAVYFQGVNLTATVSSSAGTPAGTVSFYNGSTLIASATLNNGVASTSARFSSVGSFSITASYGGDANHTSSASSALVETINKASTTTSVTSSQNPQLVSQPITFTATIVGQFGGAAGGSVTFKSGATTLGTAAISGNQASLTTSFATTGTRSITAQYGGDTNDTGSTSAALSQSIVAKFSTATTLTSSLNPSFVGQAATFTATVSSPGGIPANGELITFKRGATTLATVPLASGSASFTTSALAAGTNTITASYPGDATFNTSTSAGLKQVVNKYATTTALTSSLNPSIFGQAVTFTATVTSAGPNTPTGTVTFKNGTTTLATVTLSGGTATLTRSNLSAGTLSITAAYNGDTASAVSTSATLSQVVNQATTTTTLVSSRNPSTFGQTVKFTATVSSTTVAPTGTVTFFDGATTLGTGTLAGGKASFSTTALARGSHSITAVYGGTANIAGSSSSVLIQAVN